MCPNVSQRACFDLIGIWMETRATNQSQHICYLM